jgi:polysaccharide deacetylase family protein (PEP-CTERM system associated)|tara:strand:- start:14183 stop:15031 length:849 start_codon:yes stop_codon:yes gene_type:complete
MKILTFDIEEWFHILDNKSTENELQWNKYETRIHKNVDRILEFLVLKKLNATFFIVGWIAEKYPEVVKKIDELGFEIGSHTHMHQLVYRQTKHQFSEDIKKSIYILESITNKKVTSFRAPGFSITEKNKWAFEVLYENGIKKDSSVFPSHRSHGGFPSYGITSPSRLSYNGIELKEFPISTFSFFNNNFIYSGGGYFRVSPYPLINFLSKKSDYIMAYFHPRDFDSDQPVIPNLTTFRRFKSYVGISSCMLKLNKWVDEFDFTDLRVADNSFDWDIAPIVKV